MATTINESGIPSRTVSDGVWRQHLLTETRVKGTKVLLDRVTIEAGAKATFDVPPSNLAWCHVLEGAIVLTHGGQDVELTQAHVAFLPPCFTASLKSHAGAALLYAEVPDAARFDPGFTVNPPTFRIVDWTLEPVLDSRHDARKRIYLVTPRLFGTKAIKGEMIIYPPGTEGSNHHHEGAEHFMYVLCGNGTAYANEEPIAVRKGDLIYYEDRERHYLRSEGAENMSFVEFFVPGEYKTVWAEDAPVCTWLPTGRNIRGEKPVREIKAHSSAQAGSPQDV